MTWLILKFPSITDFIEHLIARKIRIVGRVIVEDRKPTTQGVQIVSYSFRFTAKDSELEEVLMSDQLFYHGIWITREETMKEAEKPEKEVSKYLEEKIKEACKGKDKDGKDYALVWIKAEFKLRDAEP